MKRRSIRVIALVFYFASGLLLVSAKLIEVPPNELNSSCKKYIKNKDLLTACSPEGKFETYKNYAYRRLVERMFKGRE
jgi:hypothetical protein